MRSSCGQRSAAQRVQWGPIASVLFGFVALIVTNTSQARGADFDLPAGDATYNQRQVGSALDALSPTATGALEAMIDGIALQSPGDMRQSLQMLDAELYGDMATIVLESDDMYLRTNLIHLRQTRYSRARQGAGANRSATFANAAATGTSTPIRLASSTDSADIDDGVLNQSAGAAPVEIHGWGQTFGALGRVSNNGNAVGLNYSFTGLAVGFDRWEEDETLVGLGGGYNHTGVTQNDALGNGHVESLYLSLYGVQNWDEAYVLGLIGYAHDSFYIERFVNVPTVSGYANGSYDGNELLTYLEGGLDVDVLGWTLQPLVALRYLLLGQSGFSETGAGAANLAVQSALFDSLRYSMGARLTRAFEAPRGVVVTPYLQGRWAHEVLSNERLIDAQFAGSVGGSFVSLGNVLGRDFGDFGAGLMVAVNPRLMLYLAYDAQVSTRQSAHGGAGGFACVW